MEIHVDDQILRIVNLWDMASATFRAFAKDEDHYKELLFDWADSIHSGLPEKERKGIEILFVLFLSECLEGKHEEIQNTSSTIQDMYQFMLWKGLMPS